MEKARPNITFFLPSLEPGGTERNVINLINNISNKYSPTLLLGKKEGDFVSNVKNAKIISLNANSSFMMLVGLIRYLKRESPNIFVSAFPRINIISILAKMLSGSKTKIIITEHSVFSFLPIIAKTFFRRLFAMVFMSYFAKFFYPKADGVICVSGGIYDDLLKIVRNIKNASVIYNPIIDDKIYNLSNEKVNEEWFYEKTTPIIIAVGRLVECKDYPTLLEAFSILLQNRKAKLVILGRGPEKDYLLKLSENLKISKQVQFMGFKENPYKYMKNASVFVLSSSQEGFGNVIVEAMACGVPVISTDCPTGPAEIIEDKKNGLLVRVGDYEDLAKKILYVLDNPEVAKNLSINGEKRAKDFLISSSVASYENVFDKVIQR